MTERPKWSKARAALIYEGVGRRLVLGLKHGDRYDIAAPAGKWMAQRAQSMHIDAPLVCPVPLHPFRQIKRRFNQASLLSKAVAADMKADHCVDALYRRIRTQSLDGKTREERFAHLKDAISVTKSRKELIEGRNILLVDDVMTSGATLTACTEALQQGGAGEIFVCVMARVASRP